MGRGASNTMARIAASVGELEAVSPEFQPVLDVPNGGVLFALPALLATGLLKFTARYFRWPKGFYGLASLLVLLAFMALSRIKTIESLRDCAPGEWGTVTWRLGYRRSTSSERSNVIGSTVSKVSMGLANRVARRY